nr:monocarboxylate transporter 4-like [Lytechinus pictus]
MGGIHEIVSSPSFPVVVCIFMWAFSHVGIIKVIAIYLDDINIELGSSPTDFGVALGLFNASCFFLCPITAALFRHNSIRRMLLISGACLPAIGVALTSIATSITQVAICMSITGLGIGNLMVVTNLTLHWVAKENYNLYLSIGLTGYGPGMVLLPLLAEYLRGPYGWRGGLLITSALLANIIPCAVGMTLETREHYTKWNDPKSDYRSLSSDSDGSDCEEGHKHREIGETDFLLS